MTNFSYLSNMTILCVKISLINFGSMDLKSPCLILCPDFTRFNRYMDGFTTNDSDKFFSSLIKLIRPNKIFIDNATARQVLNRLDMTVEALMEQVKYDYSNDQFVSSRRYRLIIDSIQMTKKDSS